MSVTSEPASPALSIVLCDDAFELRFAYQPTLVDAVKELPGRRWNPTKKLWTVPTASGTALQRLIDRMPAGSALCDPAASEFMSAQAKREIESLVASRATDRADINLPVPEGLAYLPYQRAGIAYALSHPNVLFGDEMGLGKTIQAIGTVNADESIIRVAVVSPASLKLNWKREIEKWSVRTPRTLVAAGSPPTTIRSWDALFRSFFARLSGGIAEGVQWLIVNYDIIDRWYPILLEAQLDALILDECHYCKNPKAKRTQMIFGKWDRKAEDRIEPIPSRRILALTGTPIPNRPVEAWPIVHRLAPDIFRSYRQFASRYCGGGYNGYAYDASGASNLPELQERLRASIMVRRLKADVLTELPAKRRAVIELPSDSPAVAAEAAAWQAHQDQLMQLRAAVELAKASESEEEYQQAVAALKAGASAAFTELSKLRHQVALAKVPLVVAHLKDCLAEGKKVLCFAHHTDVIANIIAAFPECAVKITGDTPVPDRQGICDQFQAEPNTTLFVGNIRAAGVGLTLTASAHVVFAELDWVPGNITQAEDRAHRIGQRESVLVQHLVLEGSLDAVMANRLVAKQAIIDAVLDKEDAAASDEPLLPLKLQAATESTTRRQIIKTAEQLAEGAAPPAAGHVGPVCIDTPRVRAIHECLRMLAGMCDGASARDGAGFNKVDAHIGHSLAGAPGLTAKQAALGLRLVTKYRRQLPSELLALAKDEQSEVAP